MTSIQLEEVCVDFPIINGPKAHSLKRHVLDALTGGKICSDPNGLKIVNALKNIDLQLAPGDRLGVIGANGSGKSTLLKLIARIYEPTKGSADITGKVTPLLNIALGAELELTGRENIYLRGRLLGCPAREIADKLQEIIEYSGLGAFIDLPMRTYSSGMILRLMFAICTSIQSDILIMDEWLSVGDSDFGLKADIKLRQIVATTPIVIIASHDHELISRHCNRKINLSQGRIVAVD